MPDTPAEHGPLTSLLEQLDACTEAVKWCEGKELAEAWNTCNRADWMLWLCGKMIGKDGWPSHQEIVLAGCLCAETVLPIYEQKYPGDDRPRKAIEGARQWAKGEMSIDKVYAAAHAARAANASYDAARASYDAAYAAYAAARAAYAAAYDAAYAAYAAANAAYAAARAAYAAAYDVDAAAYDVDAAYAAKQKELANIVRANLNIPERKKNER